MGVFEEINLKIKIEGQIKTGDLEEDIRLKNTFTKELELLCAKYDLNLEYLEEEI